MSRASMSAITGARLAMSSRVVPFPVRSQTTAGPGRSAITQTAKSSSLLTITVALSLQRNQRSLSDPWTQSKVENVLAVVTARREPIAQTLWKIGIN